MLIKDYYQINSVAPQADGTVRFAVTLKADCPVYEGHFPGQPVSPGVCNIQMIKECAEQVAGKSLLMNNLQQARLTVLMTPEAHPEVEVVIALEANNGAYKLKAAIEAQGEKCLELKAELTEA